jgi:hypothetical protein
MLTGLFPAPRWDAPAQRPSPGILRLTLVLVAAMAGVLCHAGVVGATTMSRSGAADRGAVDPDQGVADPGAADQETVMVPYEGSSEVIANPERGFYDHDGDCDKEPFILETLREYREKDKVSLVLCIFYLAEFKASPISQEQLDWLQQQADTVRDAGLKMIVRFAYTTSEAGDDAPVDQVEAHLVQLAPYIRSNADVIAVVQSGFVGAWGEGYYTQNFGNEGNVSDEDWEARERVVEKLLSILPVSRKVQMRTLLMKKKMYGNAPTTAADVTAGREKARVGYHNDCFLGGATDQGTYEQDITLPDSEESDETKEEYKYLAADTTYVPMGGETCEYTPRSECIPALKELDAFHYSYVNRDYLPDVLNRWIAGGCMAEVDRRLGYRFALVSVTSATTVTRGTNMAFQMTIQNHGWSSAINHRSVWLVLRDTTTGAVHKLLLTSTRNWNAGSTHTLRHHNLTIPSTIPVGTYELLLSLPDPTPSLANRPEYAIQLANAQVWEPSTGFNRLLRTVKVK